MGAGTMLAEPCSNRKPDCLCQAMAPVREQARGAGYDAWPPTGPVDVWKTSIYSYEFPLVAAQSCIYACELTGGTDGKGDAELLAAARRWADVIETNLPPKAGRRWKKELEEAMPEWRRTGGNYAEDYGRTISFFAASRPRDRR